MKLNFLGCGSGFTGSHNNAFFTTEANDIIFIDLSMLNIQKALDLVIGKNKIYLLITHMHDDHVSGIPLFTQYLYYTLGKKQLNIVVPEALYANITAELRIKGIAPYLYNICVYNLALNQFVHPYESVNWLKCIIPTEHAPELYGRCFGYELQVSDTHIIYTGDTCQLSDFIPSLDKGYSEFYVDCSYDYGNIHLKWDDIKHDLQLIATEHDVYLMHLDNRKAFLSEDLCGMQLTYEYTELYKEEK